MFFTLKNLPEVDSPTKSVKFLGVFVDSKLTWKPHIDFVAGNLQGYLIYLLKI